MFSFYIALLFYFCYFYHSRFFLFSFCSSSGCSTWICMALGRWLREPALGIWFWTAFYDSRPTNEEMVHTGRRGIGGKRLSHLFRCIHLELISFCGLCLYARLFFSSFSHVSFFFNQAILFINLHEGVSAWFTGRKGDDMTTVGPRMAGMGATGHRSDFCVYCTRTIFSLPLFLNGFYFFSVFFYLRYLLSTG